MKVNRILSTILWQVVIFICHVQGKQIGSRPECIEQPCLSAMVDSQGPNNVDCYRFEASDGISFCSTALSCGILVPCDRNKQCASEELVCVVNSCCLEPVCIPIKVARHLCPLPGN